MSLLLTLAGFALAGSPVFAQNLVPPPRAEDPAYYDEPTAAKHYTEERVDSPSVNPPLIQPESRAPASDSSLGGTLPPPHNTPTYLDQVERDSANPQVVPQRMPAANDESPRPQRQQPAPVAQSQTESTQTPVGTQLAFFELTPTIGSISIKDKSAFTVGSNLSFRLTKNSGLYFEPSILMSFLSGDTQNVTLFHIDGGFRYDWVISESPLIPFVKAAVGPTIASNGNTLVNGEAVSDSYVNLLAGGGLKLLINPNLGARADAGFTLQGTDVGLYVLGSVAIPL